MELTRKCAGRLRTKSSFTRKAVLETAKVPRLGNQNYRALFLYFTRFILHHLQFDFAS